MYCHYCGNETVNTDMFCQSCGAKTEVTKTQTNQQISPEPTATQRNETGWDRPISDEEREWAHLKNEEAKHKDRQKGIIGGIILMLLFVVTYLIRSSLYSRLNTNTTIWHAVFCIGIGIVFLISGIYSTTKLVNIRNRLGNMPNYGNRND